MNLLCFEIEHIFRDSGPVIEYTNPLILFDMHDVNVHVHSVTVTIVSRALVG